MKAEGVKRGVGDLMLPVARGSWHGLFVEMKREHGGKLSPEQKVWFAALRAQGYRCEVCQGWLAAQKLLISYLEDKSVMAMIVEMNELLSYGARLDGRGSMPIAGGQLAHPALQALIEQGLVEWRQIGPDAYEFRLSEAGQAAVEKIRGLWVSVQQVPEPDSEPVSEPEPDEEEPDEEEPEEVYEEGDVLDGYGSEKEPDVALPEEATDVGTLEVQVRKKKRGDDSRPRATYTYTPNGGEKRKRGPAKVQHEFERIDVGASVFVAATDEMPEPAQKLRGIVYLRNKELAPKRWRLEKAKNRGREGVRIVRTA